MRQIAEEKHLPADIDAQPPVRAAAALRSVIRGYREELERATEPPVRRRVIRLQPDRLPVLIGRVLGLPSVEVRPGETEPHDGVVRHQLGDLLELCDTIRLGHAGIVLDAEVIPCSG